MKYLFQFWIVSYKSRLRIVNHSVYRTSIPQHFNSYLTTIEFLPHILVHPRLLWLYIKPLWARIRENTPHIFWWHIVFGTASSGYGGYEANDNIVAKCREKAECYRNYYREALKSKTMQKVFRDYKIIISNLINCNRNYVKHFE